MGGGNILAPLGHVLTHAMQRTHFVKSVAILPDKIEIASVGHAVMHLPHIEQKSVDMGVAGAMKSAL